MCDRQCQKILKNVPRVCRNPATYEVYAEQEGKQFYCTVHAKDYPDKVKCEKVQGQSPRKHKPLTHVKNIPSQEQRKYIAILEKEFGKKYIWTDEKSFAQLKEAYEKLKKLLGKHVPQSESEMTPAFKAALGKVNRLFGGYTIVLLSQLFDDNTIKLIKRELTDDFIDSILNHKNLIAYKILFEGTGKTLQDAEDDLTLKINSALNKGLVIDTKFMTYITNR